MRFRLLAPMLALFGCQPGELVPSIPAEHDVALACPAAVTVDDPQSTASYRGRYIEVAPPPERTRADGESGKTVVYLNRVGATLTANYDDATHNASSVLASTGRQSATIPPYAGTESQWQQIVACVKDEFSRFNVDIVAERPTSGTYVMAMFGGTAGLVGLPPQVGGVAPIDTFGCKIIPAAIVFIFSGAFGPGAQINCEVAAQEIAHAFTLDHELLASDPMTYLQYNGHKTFQDKDAPCGESSPRACVCKRPSQNSVKVLYEKLGAAGPVGPADTRAPTVALIAPAAGAVAGNLDIVADANDDIGVAAATLAFRDAARTITTRCGDGKLPCSRVGNRFTWTISATPGAAQITITAVDAAGNSGTTGTRNVNITPAPPAGSILIAATLDDTGFATSRVVTARATVTPPAGATVTEVLLEWTDAAGAKTEWPLCPGADQTSFALPVQIATLPGPRSFTVRATDSAGRRATSPPFNFGVD